jgi:hypothetical protein
MKERMGCGEGIFLLVEREEVVGSGTVVRYMNKSAGKRKKLFFVRD